MTERERTTMATTTLNGITIRYEVSGDGAPVLLTHGFSSTGRAWAAQHRALQDRYRVISWDMRGHGQTDSPPDPAQYSHDLTVADMHGLLRHLGVERAVVGGLSLGGTMSLAFYHRHPTMVRALVICDSGPGYRNAQARAEWNGRAERRAADLEARGLDALEAGSRDMQEAVRHHRSAQGLAQAARGMLTQRDASIIDALPAVRVPTLIIVGSEDTPFIAPCEYMAKKIPGAHLEVIAGAGHSSNLDRPEAFNRVLRSFLDSLP